MMYQADKNCFDSSSRALDYWELLHNLPDNAGEAAGNFRAASDECQRAIGWYLINIDKLSRKIRTLQRQQPRQQGMIDKLNIARADWRQRVRVAQHFMAIYDRHAVDFNNQALNINNNK